MLTPQVITRLLVFTVFERNSQKLGSSHQCSKELQISKSISMQAGFIAAEFSDKRMCLAKVGQKGKNEGGKGRGWQEQERSLVTETIAPSGLFVLWFFFAHSW